ncbi:MAG: class I SAM-dependent methyltransferase [Candidatus Omnitrophica bacterium]|nr:class I SAM-dependent methyltransferase [Candidatus Omnitrophota bacterium]
MKSSIYFYGGLFFVTLASLMLEIIQTRILSVTTWYHLAFFAISIAMFGLTAGAVWVYHKGKRFSEKTLSSDLTYYSSAFALSTAICFVMQMTLTPHQNDSLTFFLVWLEIAVCMAVPFFFAGVVVSLSLTRSPYRIGRIYAVDLAGAATGCLGVLWVMNLTDGPSAVLWIGAIAALGAVLFRKSNIGEAPSKKRWLHRPLPILLMLAIAATLNGMTWRGIQPLFIKDSINHRKEPLFFEQWNTFSRVAVYYQDELQSPSMWGKSPNTPPDKKIHQFRLNIDGAAGTSMPEFHGKKEEVNFLPYDITNLAYSIRPSGRGAVIGVGGGRDVLSAWHFGLDDIIGLEINPIFIDLLTQNQDFCQFNEIANMPGIHLIADEARSWFARTKDKFDIIQISMIDTWATTSAGAFTLSENGIYTVEAFKTFIEKLKPNGVLTVSRWYAPGEVNETGRLISLATAALLEEGAIEPQRHIFLASANRKVATLALSRQQLSPSDIQTLKTRVRDLGFMTVISPDEKPASEVLENIMTAKDREELDAYTSRQVLDLTPPTDDKPFFFNQLPLHKPFHAMRMAKDAANTGVIAGNLKATATLLTTLSISMILALAILVIPLGSAVRETSFSLAVGGTFYFSLLGLGFMFAEMGLIQRLSVFLGHPTYSLSVVLFSLILSTGLGSFLSDRWALRTKKSFCFWVIFVCIYILMLPMTLKFAFNVFQSADALLRIIVSIVVIAPMGILLGFGFPSGMSLVENFDKKPTPWFWGVNGATGVLASGLTVATSITFGISASFWVAAACYSLLIPAAFMIGFPGGSRR